MAVQMTRAEYEAKYGKPPAAKTAPVKMTQAQYDAKYGAKAPSVAQKFEAGMKEATGARTAELGRISDAQAQGVQGPARSAFQVGGQLVGAAIDPFVQGVKAVVPDWLKTALAVGAKAASPLITKPAEALSKTKLFQEAAAGSEQLPIERDIKAGLEYANLLPIPKGAGAAARIAPATASLAKKVLPTAERSAEKAVADALEVTSPNRYKKDSIDVMLRAGQSGGAEKKGLLGAYKAKPTDRDIEIAKSVQKVVSTKNGPLDNIAGVNQEIGRVSDDLSTHFSKNKVPFNFEDLRKSSELVQPSDMIKADKPAFETYSRVRESLLSKMYEKLSDTAKSRGDFGSMTDMAEVWEARIAVDRAIEKELGAAVFGSPQYTGVKAAAVDFRNGFNRFIADNVANPGQMEQVNRMHEFLQAARGRGIDIPSDEAALSILRRQFGLVSGAEDAARAAVFKDAMNRLTLMYEARGNIAESNWRLLDKNAVQRWTKQNPKKTKAIELGLGGGAAAGFMSAAFGD